MKRRLNVLVAEDDTATLEFMHAMLSSLGHHVTACQNGHEAVEAVRRGAPAIDVVLMDIQMPVMDGLEATRRLRGGPEGAVLPIICLSAKASGSTEQAGLAAGCDCYLTKPCWEEDILAAMSRVMTTRGLLRPGESLE
jgi:CheY-like chemotaxis protein